MMILNKIRTKISLLRNRTRNRFKKPSIIFYYHRIAEVKDDPCLLSVSLENFEKQLLYLKENYKIVSLRKLVAGLRMGKVDPGLVVITFDDGYADNYTNALPIIEKLKVPATFFVVAGKIGATQPFYWDKKTDMKDQGRAITRDELINMVKSPFVEIGAHTMTHPRLSELTKKEQQYEVEECRRQLGYICKKPVTFFSYPFGRLSDFTCETIDLVKAAGYEAACSTVEKTISKRASLYILPRRIVRNWNIAEFTNYIKNL